MYRMKIKITILAVITALVGVLLMLRIMLTGFSMENYSSYDMSAPREVEIICSYGDIFDRNGISLVNRANSYIAVIDPETADTDVLSGHIINREKYDECITGDALFLCEVNTSDLGDIPVIVTKERYSGSMAEHIIGYTADEKGVCGIEAAFDDILRIPRSTVKLRYSADARGNMLEGDGLSISETSSYRTGVATSLDICIQRAAEEAMSEVKKGAAIVMDIKTGEICAVVSKPGFDPAHPELSLDSEDSPFINRAFSAYSVGSVFKLVTAGAALEYGISDEYAYRCRGSIFIYENKFKCHRFGGHGTLDMRSAMVESCNPYFISLGRDIPTEFLHSFAEGLGFGKASFFCDGISSSSGHLTTVKELLIPAEKANFSFGQGMLTATPLQVTVMTAAIANSGICPEPVLIHGSTDIVHDAKAAAAQPSYRRVMKSSTADKLKSFMITTMYKENSAAVPEFTTGGGKTSTAQTWQYFDNGEEKLNCWFTGFFPADEPQYAVTVMIEEGVSGNLTCGPVFKDIADSVTLGRYYK